MHVCLSISLPIVLSAFILSLIILNSSTHKPGQIKCALTVSNTHTFTRYTTQNFTTFTVKHRSTCYCPAIYLPQIQHTHILPCYLSTTNTTHTYIALLSIYHKYNTHIYCHNFTSKTFSSQNSLTSPHPHGPLHSSPNQKYTALGSERCTHKNHPIQYTCELHISFSTSPVPGSPLVFELQISLFNLSSQALDCPCSCFVCTHLTFTCLLV